VSGAVKLGFCFAGFGPSSTGNGEALIHQYLKTHLDLSYPRVVTPLGRKILAYIIQVRGWVYRLEAKKKG
jgi:hypothetical protein